MIKRYYLPENYQIKYLGFLSIEVENIAIAQVILDLANKMVATYITMHGRLSCRVLRRFLCIATFLFKAK